MFVLSVLGIQSTEKSALDLLGTLFGLPCNITADQCTRGVYMQLLPVNNSFRENMNCDYVLIVNAEGLYAPELELHGSKSEYELAALAVGIADFTVFNLFDGYQRDLYGVLQGVLHVLIRNRKSIIINLNCVFVHQNTPYMFAESNRVLQRQIFQLVKLDEMTRAAGVTENYEELYNSFSDVINFLMMTQMCYISQICERISLQWLLLIKGTARDENCSD